MQRRDFLSAAAAGAAAIGAGLSGAVEPEAATPLARKVPRWRGFNLLEKFTSGRQGPFLESDFEWIRQWGFDFVRLPMDYRCWTDPGDPCKLDEKVLREIDQAVELGRKHGVHVNLCLHRAPGYTVARPPERLNLWESEEAQKQFDFQWSQFARRYRGIPSGRLSFNLVNEPARTSEEKYAKVVRRVTAAIRREDPQRLVIADGLDYGRIPSFSLADLGIAQSTRGYEPIQLSHYKASWVGGERFAAPTWPLREGGKLKDRDWLQEKWIAPWKKLQPQGVGVHVGEWGAFNKTPHDVVLRWARDLLGLWKDAGWGWALWNLRGSFGILDSQREDAGYEDFHGHKLDRGLLELLREF
ncbi:MAG: cellulase family glycosylhydrolase [Thermoguttaceae bacterium]|jgi:endoglucanase